jgi:hypothetical protein
MVSRTWNGNRCVRALLALPAFVTDRAVHLRRILISNLNYADSNLKATT